MSSGEINKNYALQRPVEQALEFNREATDTEQRCDNVFRDVLGSGYRTVNPYIDNVEIKFNKKIADTSVSNHFLGSSNLKITVGGISILEGPQRDIEGRWFYKGLMSSPLSSKEGELYRVDDCCLYPMREFKNLEPPSSFPGSQVNDECHNQTYKFCTTASGDDGVGYFVYFGVGKEPISLHEIETRNGQNFTALESSMDYLKKNL